MKKYATIKDIAKALNISIATVSRALSNSGDVNLETKKMVLEEAERQNYKPNIIAQRLQTKRSKTIGIVIPEFKSTFFPNAILGIQSVLQEEGFQLLITQSNESIEEEVHNLRLLENNMVEGIIISIICEGNNAKCYQDIINGGIPIVFFNRVNPQIDAPKVIIDDYKYAFFATEHLIYSGFKDIIHFGGPKDLIIAKDRKKGFVDAMKKHHLPISDDSFIDTGISMDNGYDATLKLIAQDKLPEAIFCISDRVAIGVMQALKEKGIPCPDRVALMGFTETEMARFLDPPLTSVEQPTYEIGKTAARLLLEKINNPFCENKEIVLPAKINIRKSSFNINSK